MFNLLRLGQGPRPDLLEEEFMRNMKRNQEMEKRSDQDTAGENAESKGESTDHKDLQRKDIVAMIIALFQLLLPWIAGVILIYFLFIFILTRI